MTERSQKGSPEDGAEGQTGSTFSWKRHGYHVEAPNENISFLSGANVVELEACMEVLGGRSLTPNESVKLQRITGCRTFGEFRRRVLSTHPLVDQEVSLLLIEELSLAPGEARMGFKVLLYAAGHQPANNEVDDEAGGLGFIRRQLDYKRREVTHAQLTVEEGYEGRGLATHLVQSHEEAWAAAGYKVIRLVAGLEDGWRHWAKQGYDFDPTYDSESQARRLVLRLLDELEAGVLLGVQLPEGVTVRMLHTQVQGVLRSWDVIRLGEALNVEERIMPRNWDGIKELRDDYEGHVVAAETRADAFRDVPIRTLDDDEESDG